MEVNLTKHVYIHMDIGILFPFSGYTLCIFIDGDYEFLSKIYGISGASGKTYMYTLTILTGKHCCVFCSITKEEMKVPLAHSSYFEDS